MNILNSQNQKDHSNRLNKRRLNQDQVRLLEASFNYNKKLEPEQKLQLARQLGVPPRQIAIWYQNKRARWKNQSLELDYGALQLRLETALAEKRQLEKEVQQLQGELQKAQETLLAFRQAQEQHHQQQQQQQQQLPPISSFSDCCDEGGGTSSCSWETGDQAMQLEDLYACLIGAEGSACRSTGENEKFSLFKV